MSLPGGWTFELRPGGGYQAVKPGENPRIGTDRWPNGHYYQGVGCSDPVCRAVDARNRLGDPSNPIRSYGDPWKWHPPGARA